jgi:hypothetical protein
MKTDDLIRAMAADAPARTGTARRHALVWLAVAMPVVALLFNFVFELREDLLGEAALATVQKLTFTVLLLAAAARGATILMSPDARLRDAMIWIAAPLAALLVFIAGDLAFNNDGTVAERAIGESGLDCIVSLIGLSALPLAAFLYGMRDGASTRPGLAGALAGVSAASMAASFYALHCVDDSALFVGLWYGLGIALVGAIGYFAGQRFLRW